MKNNELKIQLIEDDIVDQKAFKRFVKKNHIQYDYIISASVAEAKDHLNSRKFDIIVSDYLLGDGTAFDIFDMKIDIPIIVTTGSGDEEIAVKAMKAGAYDYLIKDPERNYLKVLPSIIENAIERKKAKDELKKYQIMVESANDAIFFKDLKSKYIIANNKMFDFFGLSCEEVIGKTDLELMLIKEEAMKIIENDQVVFKTGRQDEFINHMTGADGKEYWFQTIKVPNFNTTGNITGLVGIARDITENMQAEEQIKAALREKEILLKEIHHRVKNNLQIVISLLNMQLQTAKDQETIDILSESRNRINTMALIHTQLYETQDVSEINVKVFVEGLLQQLLQSYQIQDTRITPVVHVVDYPLPVSIAVHVGLIINELLANAFEHAFGTRKKGKIEVSLSVSDKSKVNLTVSDDGTGLPEGFDIDSTGTLGMRLVKILVEDQLQGNIQVISKKGTTFNIEFQIENDET